MADFRRRSDGKLFEIVEVGTIGTLLKCVETQAGDKIIIGDRVALVVYRNERRRRLLQGEVVVYSPAAGLVEVLTRQELEAKYKLESHAGTGDLFSVPPAEAAMSKAEPKIT